MCVDLWSECRVIKFVWLNRNVIGINKYGIPGYRCGQVISYTNYVSRKYHCLEVDFERNYDFFHFCCNATCFAYLCPGLNMNCVMSCVIYMARWSDFCAWQLSWSPADLPGRIPCLTAFIERTCNEWVWWNFDGFQHVNSCGEVE